MTTVTVMIRRLPHGRDLPLPTRRSEQAAGIDLMAALGSHEKITLNPLERGLVGTGFALQIPHGYEGQVRPRSGLALEHGISVLNAPGTIDADYRGEVKVLLVNLGAAPFTVTHGLRIAQLVIAPVARPLLIEAAALDETARGDRGFGSTGMTIEDARRKQGD